MSQTGASAQQRIFLDANVLFSAARASGPMRQLLHALKQKGHVLVAQDYVIEEAKHNLARKEGPSAVQDLARILRMVETDGVRSAVSKDQAQLVLWLPEKDRPVLLSAMTLQCTTLVTGDRSHFGANYGQTFGMVKICSPAQLAADLLGPRI